MTIANAATGGARDRQSEPAGVTVPVGALDQPGTYICNWSGHLLRVPATDQGLGCFAALGHLNGAPWTVTRISPDPQLSRVEAKALAGTLGLETNF
jgi:hypothetical protein